MAGDGYISLVVLLLAGTMFILARHVGAGELAAGMVRAQLVVWAALFVGGLTAIQHAAFPELRWLIVRPEVSWDAGPQMTNRLAYLLGWTPDPELVERGQYVTIAALVVMILAFLALFLLFAIDLRDSLAKSPLPGADASPSEHAGSRRRRCCGACPRRGNSRSRQRAEIEPIRLGRALQTKSEQ